MIKTAVVLFIASFFAILPVSAQMRPVGPPTASVRIDELQVAFIGSGAIGGGTLKFGDRS
jgi:hypothetical protein